MIKRPLLGMFLMMTAGLLLGKGAAEMLLPMMWKTAEGSSMTAGLVLTGMAVPVTMVAGGIWFGFRHVFGQKFTLGRENAQGGKIPQNGVFEQGRALALRLLLLGAVLGLFRGGQYELQYQGIRQVLETACQKDTRVYAAGLITQVRQTETSIFYQLSHCTLEVQGESGSVPDLIIYRSIKTKYKTHADSRENDVSPMVAGEEITEFSVGDYVTFCTVPTGFSKATNDGGYDEQAACYEKGIVGKFLSPEMKLAEVPWYLALWGKVLAKADCLVQYYQQAFQSVLSKENLGILEAMCLGKKEHLTQEQKDAFQNAGISHILAISGVHISILGMFLFQRIRKCRISIGSACVLAMLLSLLFAISTGSGTSALRAVVMFGVFLGSIFWGKNYDGLSSMAFAGMILLLAEPSCIAGASFRYSFAAIAGIFGVQELIRCKYKSLHPILSSLLVSVAAWLVTLPLTAWYQYRITTYSMLLNLLVIPLASPILVGGLFGGGIKVLAGVLGGVSGEAGLLTGICSFAGNGLLKMAELCITLLRWLAGGYGKLPGGNLLVGKPNWRICVAFYIVLLIIYILAKNRKIFLYFVGMIPLILIIAYGNQTYENKVVFLDVGQGDGIYLESADGRNYFIDGGSSSESLVGRYTLQPFLEYHARDSIDVWFVSHCDSDHISGLLELLEDGCPIGRIVFVRDVVREENYNSIIELAKQREIPVSYMEEGDYVNTECLSFTSLRGGKSGEEVPENFGDAGNLIGGSTESGEDPNDHCLVLLAEYASGGQTFLFAGDSSIEAEEEFLPFLQKQLAGRTLFLMKADHHGSKNSNGEALLQLAQPEVAVISCSSTNLYGHPHPDAVNRIEQAGAEILYTMKSGQVTIGMEQEGNRIMEFRKE